MKNIRKGLLLNFTYEGSYIIVKLILFCLVFYVVQVLIGYQECNNQADILSYSNSMGNGYLIYSELFNKSIMPYVLTVFTVASIGGVYYIFHKDKVGANKLNSIYTLPFPRYCNYIAKFFYATLCPLSVYAVQILVNVTLMNFSKGNVSFRANELYLSTTFNGVYQTLFSPTPVAVYILLLSVFLVSAFVHDLTARSINSSVKVKFIANFVSYILIYTSFTFMLRENMIKNEFAYIFSISACVLCICINLFSGYRKVRL